VGFLPSAKYLVAPKPQNLHWFYWESYSTWLTGFALFTVLFTVHAATFLVDKSVDWFGSGAAIGAARFGSGWLCTTPSAAPLAHARMVI
jgi:uncharacterized membrane protein